VSYLRVSTGAQAERDLSIPAQRRSVEDFAQRHGATISAEYEEAGASGRDLFRPVMGKLLRDALAPGSTIHTIVVHHTSRFTRDATQARIVKSKLRRAGIRVLSVSQDLRDDPMGKLMEGLFECIDQYESEINGLRTSAALREAVRQGYYPAGQTPFGFRKAAVELRPGVTRYRLEPDPVEAPMVREVFRLYVTESGAKAVAQELNRRGMLYRKGYPWDKGRVLHILEQTSVIGILFWGKTGRDGVRPPEQWTKLQVPEIVDAETYELAQNLRARRERKRNPGRGSARPHVLTGLLVCAACGQSFQLETSGKKVDGTTYRYCYYNCRSTTRIGTAACKGNRIRTELLDAAVVEALIPLVCTRTRARILAARHGWDTDMAIDCWASMLREDHRVAREYLVRLVEKIEVDGDEIRVTPKPSGRIHSPTAAIPAPE
jgi:DNA invertase Pin-like site-specific DNA recombinase